MVQTSAQQGYNISEGQQDLRKPTGPEKAQGSAVQEVCVCKVRCSAKRVGVWLEDLGKRRVGSSVKVSEYIVCVCSL